MSQKLILKERTFEQLITLDHVPYFQSYTKAILSSTSSFKYRLKMLALVESYYPSHHTNNRKLFLRKTLATF